MTLLLTLDDGSIHRKLTDAVEFAHAALLEDAPAEQVGAHVGVEREDAVSVSHLFEAAVPGYRGWRWSVTVALASTDGPVTLSEIALAPGPDALVAPAWVPWERRVRAGDLGVGDIFPADKDDPRLVPAYLQSDDPAVEEVAHEAGLGRVHVLSRFGREDAATRWHTGEFGPRSDMARSAPGTCGTCGFFVPLAGSLRGAFGACTNDIAPADGHVVDVEYGCGAHSEVEVEVTSSVPVAELVYDDSLLDFAPAPEPEPEPEPEAAGETDAVAAAPEEAAEETAPAEVPEAEASEAKAAEPGEPEAAVAEPEAVAVVEAVEAVTAEPVVAPEESPVDATAEEAVATEPSQDETPEAAPEPEVSGAPEAEATAPVTEPAEVEVPEAAAEAEPTAEAAPEAEPAEQTGEAAGEQRDV
ncbi:DUF3027 domain-containing protein [Amycolatopsis sp. NPDC059021]|uniref:DUF3027 domain-containing protein n=1 Tax=Amycolatopsis sp. NPDC059021 TaxID=3346704 RepID=UPI00366F4293